MTLIVGFDSAWTAGKQGGIVAVAAGDAGYVLVCPPTNVRFFDATTMVKAWRHEHSQILLMLDQPTIVANEQTRQQAIVSIQMTFVFGQIAPLVRFGQHSPDFRRQTQGMRKCLEGEVARIAPISRTAQPIKSLCAAAVVGKVKLAANDSEALRAKQPRVFHMLKLARRERPNRGVREPGPQLSQPWHL
ncbi:MAG: hypothetical protein KDI37_15890 [Xanthomonadales bacterium]|nr:hypothetical protein [Xanthomonadales bacterium]